MAKLLADYIDAVASGKIKSLAPLLSLFSYQGKPMDLRRHFQLAPMYNLQMPTHSIYQCGRQVGKTLIASSVRDIYTPTGRRIANIAECVPGCTVLAYDQATGRVIPAEITKVFRNYRKKLLKITTRMGSVLHPAADHHLLTENGYIRAGELKPHDRLASIRRGGVFSGAVTKTESEIACIAYWLGDGNFTQSVPGLSIGSQSTEQLSEIRARLQEWGCREAAAGANHAFIGTVGCQAARWLEESGLKGVYSHNKAVPGWVYDLSRRKTVFFLERLWATDGTVHHADHRDVSFTSTSRDLCRDVRRLLNKLGIMCSIAEKRGRYKREDGTVVECRKAYTCRVEGPEAIRVFRDTLNVPDKPLLGPVTEEYSQSNRDTMSDRTAGLMRELFAARADKSISGRTAGFPDNRLPRPCYRLTRKKFMTYMAVFQEMGLADHPIYTELMKEFDSDITWDEIQTIEEGCVEDCFDIEVATYHNFVIDGVVSHNSFGIAEKGILLSALLPDFHTLFVQPRFDQIKRFNTAIVQPLLRSMTLRDQVIDKQQISAFLMRNFKRNSIMYMEFCLLSPDRTRGISGVSHTYFDECLTASTPVLCVNSGTIKPIAQIKAGDTLVSFNNLGILRLNTAVRDASPRGTRLCFRVETVDGEVIECTADHKLPTTQGVKRLSEIIEDEFERCHDPVHGRADTDDPGDLAGRRLHSEGGEKRQLSEQSRLGPARLQLRETPDIARVRDESTVLLQELRLRGLVESLVDSSWQSVDLLKSPTISEWHKNCISRVARPDRRARTGLVYRRRRQFTARQVHEPQCPGIPLRRRRVNRGLAGNQVGRALQYRGRKAQQGRRTGRVPSYPGYHARHLPADKRNTGIHAATHGLQGCVAPAIVPGMRYRTYWAQRGRRSLQGLHRGQTGAPEHRVLRCEQGRDITKEHRVETKKPRQSAATEQAQLLGRHRSQSRTSPEKCSQVQEEQSRARGRDQGALYRAAQGRPGLSGYGAAASENLLRQAARRHGSVGNHTGAEAAVAETPGEQGEGGRATAGLACSQSRCCARAAGPSKPAPQRTHAERPGVRREDAEDGQSLLSRPYAGEEAAAERAVLHKVQRKACRRRRICRGRKAQTQRTARPGHGGTRTDRKVHDLRLRSLLQGLNRVQVESLQEREAAAVQAGAAPEGLELAPVAIRSISCIGYHDVYDIEGVGLHNYMLANGLASCNCQDLDMDNMEIIGETMSATINYGFTQYTGTPKTTDGSLSTLFDRSSQGYWVIKCGCGYSNTAHPDADLFKIIGKWDDLKKTGIHCAKCGKGLDCREGYFKHLFPDRRATFPGYQVGQITHPLHCALKKKWNTLLYKYNNYTKAKFYNEIAGIPCDESVKLLTLQDLSKHCNGIAPTKEAALKIRRHYETVVLGVDWSGGGALGKSYTAGCILGARPGVQRLDVLHAFRLPMGMKPEDEAAVLLTYMHEFKCSLLAHDYTGAGYLREVILNQAGIPMHQLIPFTYAFVPKKDIISLHAPADGARASYILDKARSLAIMCGLIRSGMITLPKTRSKDDHPVITDLLALVEDPKEMPRGGIAYMIQRSPDKSDDFAHALNLASSAIWKMRGGYPNVIDVSRYELSTDMLAAIDPGMARMLQRP